MGNNQSRRIEERLARELGLVLILLLLALIQVTLLTAPTGFCIPLLLVLAIGRALVGAGTAEPVRGFMRGLGGPFTVGLRWICWGQCRLAVMPLLIWWLC